MTLREKMKTTIGHELVRVEHMVGTWYTKAIFSNGVEHQYSVKDMMCKLAYEQGNNIGKKVTRINFMGVAEFN